MNVGYLYCFNSYPPRNGGSVHVYNLTQHLTKLGCVVHAFEPEQNPECVVYPTSDEGITRWLNAIDVIYMRVDSWYLGQSKTKVQCMNRAGTKPMIWEINASSEEILQERKASFFKDAIAPRRISARLIAERKLLSLRLKLAREESFRRRSARKVKAACCVSNPMQRYATSSLGISETRVIPNGSDPDLFHPGLCNEGIYRGYAHYFKVIFSGDARYPWQGFGFVKEMAARAEREGHPILFIVLSNTPVEQTRECRNLLFLNRVEYSRVPTYLASADACLCLYHDGFWSKYGFHLSPLKLFDYMASGKPVIASRLGQIATVITDGKDGLLTPNRLDAIYQRVQFCQENRESARQIGQAARQKICQYYNWERAARETMAVFDLVSMGLREPSYSHREERFSPVGSTGRKADQG